MGSLCISYRINNVQYAAFSLYVPTPISLSPPTPTHTFDLVHGSFLVKTDWLTSLNLEHKRDA